jgi:hypothetical protein
LPDRNICLTVRIVIAAPRDSFMITCIFRAKTKARVNADLASMKPPQMNEVPDRLWATDEPPPFTVDNENGTSPLLIVADHAGKRLPRRLGQLGLSKAECERHIVWDIGAGAVCRLIGKALDAVVVRQNYSRLVIDCKPNTGVGNVNRRLERDDARAGKRRPERPLQARAHSGDIPALLRSYRVRARSAARGRPTDSHDCRAQLHSRFRCRGTALACRRALQPRPALRPDLAAASTF